MAGILRTDSIIADSITSSSSSSSPSRPVSEHSNASTHIEPPTKVKRVGRTYGRPKPDTHAGGVVYDDPASRARILKTAPRDADDLVIPQSDDTDEHPLNFDGFGWRAELKAIDAEFDMSGEKSTAQPPKNASTTEDGDASTARQDVGGLFRGAFASPLSILSHISLAASEESSISAAPNTVGRTDAMFDGARSSLLSSDLSSVSSPLQRRTHSNSDNNIEESAPFSKYRAANHRVVESPDPSESDNASPQRPYPINSPKQRSSPTPPTSPLAEEFALDNATASGTGLGDNAIRYSKKVRETNKGKASDKDKSRGKRPKAPTKKEVVEIQKESSRLLAEQHVSIPRTQTQIKHTIASLFNKLKNAPTVVKQDSDPITSFSSPAQVATVENASSSDDGSQDKSICLGISGTISQSTLTVVRSTRIPLPERDNVVLAGSEDADEDMPEPEAILLNDEAKRLKQAGEQPERDEAEKRAMDLEMRKRKALETSNLHSGAGNVLPKARLSIVGNSDTDDDLEIIEDMVGPPRASHVRGGKDVKPLFSSGVEMPFGSRDGERGKTSRSVTVAQKNLKLAATPIFLAKKTSIRKGGQEFSVTHTDLNSMMLQQADKQSDAIEEKKKELWIKGGGTFKNRRAVDDEQNSITDWLHKGSTRKDAMEVDDDDDDDDDEDPEYIEGVEVTVADDPDDSHEEAGDMEAPDPPTFEDRMDIVDEEAEADKENHRPAPRRQRTRAIVDSDEEDETPNQVISRGPVVLAPDSSFGEGDCDSPSEDKENSAELAFDLSEDKENAIVPRHLPRGRFFDDIQQGGDELWPSSSSPVFQGSVKSGREPLGRLDAEGVGAFAPPPLAQRRDPSEDRVLQVLHEEDKDATLAVVTSVRKGALHRSSSHSLLDSDDEDAAQSKSVFTQGYSQPFARDSNADDEDLGPESALGEGGFSQFFSQGKPESDNALQLPLKDKSRSELASSQDGFEFTQPNALLPSVKISNSQRREIDEMFGKDQAFKLDEAKRCREPVQATASCSLPDSLALNFGIFPPSQPSQLSPHSIRRPLETLSLESSGAATQFDESPGTQPARHSRLRRERPRNQQDTLVSISPSPPPSRRNAFDVLRDAAKGKVRERPAKAKRSLETSEFVEAEAQESDEEAMFGFGGAKGDDDEEGGDDDPNAIVEGLVDDALMDEKVQAADLVLEKHMEHQTADDEALQKLHQDATEGKLRGKRRDRGIGLEDSDSDEEDFKGPRKPLNKKRRVEGDTLDTYGENQETRPFYDSYHLDLVGDEDYGLAYLHQQDPIRMDERCDGSDEEETREVVDPAEIRRQVLEGPCSPGPELDPYSVDWVDPTDQDMDDEIRVADGPLHPRKVATGNHPVLDHVGYRGLFKGKKSGTGEKEQLKTWATEEARAHSSASGRGGFSRKDDGKPSRKPGVVAVTTTKGSAYAGEGHALMKSSSLISRVEKRKGFDSTPDD